MDYNQHWENPETFAKHVGKKLRNIRKEKEMSLNDLAEKTQVSKLTLGKIERGRRTLLSRSFGKSQMDSPSRSRRWSLTVKRSSFQESRRAVKY